MVYLSELIFYLFIINIKTYICECGRIYKDNFKGKQFHNRREVKNRLEEVLSKMKAENNPPDVITFAGNCEPTIHPDFKGIIDDTLEVRNKYFPEARIAILSNAALIHKNLFLKHLTKLMIIS